MPGLDVGPPDQAVSLWHEAVLGLGALLAAFGGVWRYMAGRATASAEAASHVVLESASLADTRPMFILIQRLADAAERQTLVMEHNRSILDRAMESADRTARATESLLEAVTKRISEDEIRIQAAELAEQKAQRLFDEWRRAEEKRWHRGERDQN